MRPGRAALRAAALNRAATGGRIEAQVWQKILLPLALDDTTFLTVDPHVRGLHAPGDLQARPQLMLVVADREIGVSGPVEGGIATTSKRRGARAPGRASKSSSGES
jgi:CubicO group peptidase (beta-lactamase class C family)